MSAGINVGGTFGFYACTHSWSFGLNSAASQTERILQKRTRRRNHAEHREFKKACHKLHYEKNKEAIAGQRKERYKKNKERELSQAKKYSELGLPPGRKNITPRMEKITKRGLIRPPKLS